MSERNPFLFYVQVSKHLYYITIRSNYVGLIIVPCPRKCLQSVCFMLSFMLSGDVETNPGPMSKAQEVLLQMCRLLCQSLKKVKQVFLVK